jgi:hypothetical protein
LPPRILQRFQKSGNTLAGNVHCSSNLARLGVIPRGSVMVAASPARCCPAPISLRSGGRKLFGSGASASPARERSASRRKPSPRNEARRVASPRRATTLPFRHAWSLIEIDVGIVNRVFARKVLAAF